MIDFRERHFVENPDGLRAIGVEIVDGGAVLIYAVDEAPSEKTVMQSDRKSALSILKEYLDSKAAVDLDPQHKVLLSELCRQNGSASIGDLTQAGVWKNESHEKGTRTWSPSFETVKKTRTRINRVILDVSIRISCSKKNHSITVRKIS